MTQAGGRQAPLTGAKGAIPATRRNLDFSITNRPREMAISMFATGGINGTGSRTFSSIFVHKRSPPHRHLRHVHDLADAHERTNALHHNSSRLHNNLKRRFMILET